MATITHAGEPQISDPGALVLKLSAAPMVFK